MRLPISLALIAITLMTPSAALAQSPAFVRLEQAINAAQAQDPTGGVSFGIVRDGRLVESGHVGFANVADQRPAGSQTVYRIGSVTKAMTALMLMQLVEQGTVRLSDPVAIYLPEIAAVRGKPDRSPPITLIQLATHTAGLAAEPDVPGFDVGPVDAWEEQLLAALPHSSYQTEPGTRFAYSNLGYAILAAALARAAGEDYETYVARHIFLPLGMTHSSFRLTDRSGLAIGYMVDDGQVSSSQSEGELVGRGYKLPVGGVFTTLDDLAKFVAFQMGDGPAGVLEPATLQRMVLLLKTVDPGMGQGYGVGFQLFTDGNVVLQGHAGGMPGYRALEVFDRESRTGYVVLRNSVGGGFGDPVFSIFQSLNGAPTGE